MDLERYRSVAEGRAQPAFLGTAAQGSAAGPSLLDEKIELAWRIMRDCALCERRCRVDRTSGEMGFCGVGARFSYFFEQILWGEEAPLVPSHAVFFSGCNMRCAFCYATESNLNPGLGKPVVDDELAGLIESRHREGAVNVNFLGGEPTLSLPGILRCLRLLRSPIAVAWNSNFYMSEETMGLLDGIVDIFVGDIKFGNDDCARRLGGTERYVATAQRNFQTAACSADLIVRHLVLPGHISCCLRPIAEWVATRLPETPFNLMLQYFPFSPQGGVSNSVLGHTLSDDEKEEARAIVADLGLNTTRWNVPLRPRPGGPAALGRGELNTTIAIRPDGSVGFMHLHKELLDLARNLEPGRTHR